VPRHSARCGRLSFFRRSQALSRIYIREGRYLHGFDSPSAGFGIRRRNFVFGPDHVSRWTAGWHRGREDPDFIAGDRCGPRTILAMYRHFLHRAASGRVVDARPLETGGGSGRATTSRTILHSLSRRMGVDGKAGRSCATISHRGGFFFFMADDIHRKRTSGGQFHWSGSHMPFRTHVQDIPNEELRFFSPPSSTWMSVNKSS